MHQVNWGIVGCGDVTEVKSGPAFNKVNNSRLVAVMRRDAAKARDYARRHNVPAWYDDAFMLINDPAVNAIYIATPPSSHEEYAVAALEAGKPVYLEKPMALNLSSALRIANKAEDKNVKLVVAHYRRAQPFFKKIRQLINDKVIGEPRFVKVDFYKKSLSEEELLIPKTSWRVNAAISGGGLFHDLAPHQLDLAFYIFGEIVESKGFSFNQAGLYNSVDIVGGNILFKTGVIFTGLWCFNIAEQDEKDCFEIVGSKGKINFSTFGKHIGTITKKDKTRFSFNIPAHVQQPMIEEVVRYFLGDGPNPCSGLEGAKVMEIIDQFTKRNHLEV